MRDLVLSFTRKKQAVEIFCALHKKKILIIICTLSGKKKKIREWKKLNHFFSETTISSDDIHDYILHLCLFPGQRDCSTAYFLFANLKILLLYPNSFCHGENKLFLIITEAFPQLFVVVVHLVYFYLQTLISMMCHCLQQQDFLDPLGFFFLLACISFLEFFIFFHLQATLAKHY